jgi:hypothetical protein
LFELSLRFALHVLGIVLSKPAKFPRLLQSKVIDNHNFRDFLELVPEVRELVNDFYAR